MTLMRTTTMMMRDSGSEGRPVTRKTGGVVVLNQRGHQSVALAHVPPNDAASTTIADCGRRRALPFSTAGGDLDLHHGVVEGRLQNAIHNADGHHRHHFTVVALFLLLVALGDMA